MTGMSSKSAKVRNVFLIARFVITLEYYSVRWNTDIGET
jgi:hypothetical protein